MTLNIKLISTITVCLVLSACASTPELNRELVHQKKIKTINLDKMDQNIGIDVADNTTTSAVAGGLIGVIVGGAIDGNINSKRKKALEPFIEMVDNMDVNKILKNALEHHMLDGRAFSEDVVIDTEYDRSIKKPFLTPILTPSVIILGNYSAVAVSLVATTSQESDKKKPNQYSAVYRSEQAMADEFLAKREENKQYWKDNPLVLRQKVLDGLYDVAKQFSDDFNANQAAE